MFRDSLYFQLVVKPLKGSGGVDPLSLHCQIIFTCSNTDGWIIYPTERLCIALLLQVENMLLPLRAVRECFRTGRTAKKKKKKSGTAVAYWDNKRKTLVGEADLRSVSEL